MDHAQPTPLPIAAAPPFSVLYAVCIPRTASGRERWFLAWGTPGTSHRRYVMTYANDTRIKFDTFAALQRFLPRSQGLPKDVTIWPADAILAPPPNPGSPRYE